MTARRYYAISWNYGVAYTSAGARCARYFSFPAKAARDEWCEEGSPYRTAPDCREAIPAGDSELRALRAKDAADGIEQRVCRIEAAREMDKAVRDYEAGMASGLAHGRIIEEE